MKDLLRTTIESFNPNLMKTQVNIPNDRIDLFKSICDRTQTEIVVIEERKLDTRFEITDLSPMSIFHLGTSFGLEIGHRIQTEAFNTLRNGI